MCIRDRQYSKNHITFDRRILFATSVLDNGVDLKDVKIKHILGDIPEQEIFDIFDFEEFKITLINNHGLGEVIDFEKFRQKRNMKL